MKRLHDIGVLDWMILSSVTWLVFLLVWDEDNQVFLAPRPESMENIEVPAFPVKSREDYASVFSAPHFRQRATEEQNTFKIVAFGFADTPSGRRALIRFQDGEPAQAMAVGENRDGWTLVSINETTILLSGASEQLRIPFMQVTQQASGRFRGLETTGTDDPIDVLSAVKDILDEINEDSF